MSVQDPSHIYFNDYFGVTEEQLEEYGAFNVSLIVDLPLFIDPFLLFESENETYRGLHDDIIQYLQYLRDLSKKGHLSTATIKHLYCFREVRQNWLGFTLTGNHGRGLGMTFANSLSANLNKLFRDFGEEKVTKGSHLEKLCLIKDKVGRDNISDFTTNLIKDFLCRYTQDFAETHIDPSLLQKFAVQRAYFSYQFGRWYPRTYNLPKFEDDFVILTPKDMLTKDDTWINKQDFYHAYHDIPNAIENVELRNRVNAYFAGVLPKEPDNKEELEAIRKTAIKFPELIDYYIKRKEDTAPEARRRSIDKVNDSNTVYVRQFGELIKLIVDETDFFSGPLDTLSEAREKALFLKDVIENKGGHRIFWHKGKPIGREEDLQILYRLVWFGTSFDVSREVNDGRGPADYKVSKGAKGKTLVEMKLASNTQLRRQLENQVEVYQAASDAEHAIKIIIFFNQQHEMRVRKILKDLKIDKSEDIILIDGRNDNKPSGSKA